MMLSSPILVASYIGAMGPDAMGRMVCWYFIAPEAANELLLWAIAIPWSNRVNNEQAVGRHTVPEISEDLCRETGL